MTRRRGKAQYGYTIYKLGVSRLNGFGLKQDQTLTLRSFGIGASPDDADVMAGSERFCAEGQGSRIDLKKVVKYYRTAEAKDVNTV